MNTSVESATYRTLQLHYADSASYLARVRQLGGATLLDSGASHTDARFDIVTAAPVQQRAISLAELTGLSGHCCEQRQAQLIAQIASDIECHTSNIPAASDIPFAAGAIMLFSYEAGRALHTPDGNASTSAETVPGWPALHIAIYQWAIVIDHQRGSAQLVADPKLDADRWQSLQTLLGRDTSGATGQPFALLSDWQAQTLRHDYQSQIATIQRYIEAGDCYQVNLAQSYRSAFRGDSWQAYTLLRRACPMPYAAFVERPQGTVISLSPERFLSVRGDQVSTQPIKGTRSRGRTAAEDQRLARELSASEKDRAENLMIVDLLRNDLGKHCQTGSVSVPELFRLDTHANVHHLSSQVSARLHGSGIRAALQVLIDCLPGGSITGAPKLRAMEIIDELEPCPRSIYCGNLVYLTPQGNMDSNILIRSLLLERNGQAEEGNIYCWAGGGIVADSQWQDEYQESIDKIAIILATLEKTRSAVVASEPSPELSHLDN